MPTDSESPTARNVRPSEKYASSKRAIIGLAAVYLAIVLFASLVSIGNARDYLINGKPVQARIEGVTHKPGKDARTYLDIDYVAAGLSVKSKTSTSWTNGQDLKVGDKITVLVRDSNPNKVWYGPLSENTVNDKIAIALLLVVGGLGVAAALLVRIHLVRDEHLKRLSSWLAIDGIVSRVGEATRSGHQVSVTYEYDHLEYHTDFQCSEGLDVKKPVPMLINPNNPKEAVARSQVDFAELAE